MAQAIVTYQQYEAAAAALLGAQPKGTGFKTGPGVVLLIDGELTYFEPGDAIDEGMPADVAAWDDNPEAEVSALVRAELVQRFTPAEVEAYEANN